MKRFGIFLLILVLAAGFASVMDANAKGKTGASGSYKSYKGGKAIDGDTFRYKGSRYRIQQYNAPERGQPGSGKATRELQQKRDSGKYEWKPVTKDVYKRTIVREKSK